jgi:hypothetical protein
MRVSTLKDDPGYANLQMFLGCTVLLNGAEVRFCFTADEEHGMVVVGHLADGHMYVDSATGEVAVETLFGAVQIIPPAVQPPACIDPNAEMQQRDAQGALDQAIKDLARVSTQTAGRALKQLNDALRPRDPGEGLDIVAPMDHRLGRFKVQT